MAYKNKKEILSIIGLGHEITEVRKKLIVIWQAVKSCFGKGYWLNDKAWTNSDSWNNN